MTQMRAKVGGVYAQVGNVRLRLLERETRVREMQIMEDLDARVSKIEEEVHQWWMRSAQNALQSVCRAQNLPSRCGHLSRLLAPTIATKRFWRSPGSWPGPNS